MGVGGTLEREAALAAVTRLVSRARAGRGGALFVVGEAGLGKTTVLDHARKLACPDVRIGWGCGDALEASLPCGLFAAVLDTVEGPRNLLDLPGEARFGGVLRWLEATATQPVLLAFDDLHWADPDSLALVSFVVRRIRRLPVAVLCGLRPWPPAAAELATALAYDGYAAVERLAPLSREAGATLLAARLDGPVSGAVVRTAVDLCGGNPLLLDRVAVAMKQGEAASRTKIVLARFAGVPPVALRCAHAASVLGTRFRPELAAVVAQLTDREADIALDALCRTGLMRPEKDTETETETKTAAQFVHPLFRQALYDDLAVPVRTRLHARAFTALTARGLQGEALDHALRADLTGNDGAIRAVTHAGMSALRSGAPARATRHLQVAVRAAGDQAGADVLVALAESLLAAGHPGEAIPVCYRLRAEQQLTQAQRVKTLRILGRAFSATGAHHDSTTCFARAGELAEGHDPAVTIEVLLDAAMASWVSAGPATSLPLADRAYTLAANATTSLRNRAASVWGYLAFLSGDPRGLVESEAGAKAAEAQALTNLSDLYCSWDALSAFSITATFAERFKDAEYVLDMLASVAERSDAAEMASGLVITQAIVAARQGRLAEALDFAERAGSPATPLPVDAFPAGCIRAEILHQMGRSAEAGEWCDRIEPDATARGESATLLRLWNIRGQQLLGDGRSEPASELYLRLEELSSRLGIGEPCWVPWARYAITAHLSAGRPLDARRVIGWLDRSAARLPCRYPRIAAVTGRASLAEAEGDYQAAERHFHSALALHEEVILPLEQVETLLSYGAFLRRRGYPRRARPLLAQAAATAEANQAGWLYDQVREEFSVAGGRRRRGREKATRLTVQEQRVARLAAAGHSNKEIAGKLILSVKTIEYHLQQIYMKLGISSRRQLMTAQHGGQELLVVNAS